MRELLWMSEAKSRDLWRHTASLMALIANANRNPRKQRPFKPEDFSPHEQQKPKAVIKGKQLRILRDIFVRPEPAKKGS